MQHVYLKAGATSQIIEIDAWNSSKTDASRLTALAYNTANLVCRYHRQGAAAISDAQTLVDMTLGTWTSLGFKKMDDTNWPGRYQFGVPDAAIATGARYVDFEFRGAANLAMEVVRIHLDVAANVVALDGSQQSLADLKDFADTGYDPSTHKVAEVAAIPATLSAQGVWEYATRTLTAFGFTPNVANVTGTLPDVTVAGFATGVAAALAAGIEAALVNETDATALLQAIVDKFAADFPDVDELNIASIVAAVRLDVERAGGMLALAKASADSADGKLTAERLGSLDDAMTTEDLDAAVEEIVSAIPNAVRPGYVRITQATLDTDDVAIGVVAPGAVVTAYLKPDETVTVGPSEPATSVGAWYLDLPPDGLWRLHADGADWDHTDTEVQT